MNKISNQIQIRVAYIIGQLTFGGTEYQLIELARNLNHKRFKILVICLSNQAPLSKLLVEAGCDTRILNRETRGRLLVLWDLYHLFHGFKPDIVHSYAYASRAAIPVSKIFLKSKNIVSIRTQPKVQITWVDRLLGSFADHILTNSKKAAAAIQFGFQKIVPCQVIYNGIDLQKFDLEAGLDFISQSSAHPGIRVICLVARLHPVKGVDVLLDAFAIISNTLDDVQLWIVGDGPEREKLQKQAEQLGISSKVIFWGHQEKIPSILARVDIGVLSSHAEGLPNAIIEYMAAKLPVVAIDVGGNSEAVVHGKTGLLVPAGNVPALADAIITILGDPDLADQYGQDGRQRVAELFTLGRMVQETEALYEKLISR